MPEADEFVDDLFHALGVAAGDERGFDPADVAVDADDRLARGEDFGVQRQALPRIAGVDDQTVEFSSE